jgi:predicted nucleic acid-binding protein
MQQPSKVCIDTNLVVRLIIEPDDEAVLTLWNEWERLGRQAVAPSLLRYELANSLHRFGRERSFSLTSVRELLDTALSFEIEYHDDLVLHAEAIVMARRFNRPATYDAHFLALAERLGIDFYTGDRRLWNTVRHQLPWVRLVETSNPNS